MTSEMTSGSTGHWGAVIFLILLFAVFLGGSKNGSWFGGNSGTSGDFENYKATCNAEKQEIINTARTQYLIEQQAANTREVVNATAQATQNKLDFYAYQALRDSNAEKDRTIASLENRLYANEKFNEVNTAIERLSCETLKRPDVRGVGAACPSASILNGFGFNPASTGSCYV